MGNAITASFGIDLAPLQQGFAKANAISKTEATKIASTISSSLKQAERNAGRFALASNPLDFFRRNQQRRGIGLPPARPGQFPAPEEEVIGGGSRRSLRGIGTGFSIFVGVERAVSFFKQANEEAENLREKIDKIAGLTGSSAFRGVSEMNAGLKEAAATLDEIHRRDIRESGGGLGKLHTGNVGDAFFPTLGLLVKKGRQLATGGSDAEDEEQRNRLRASAAKNISDIADKQRALNEAQQEETDGSERQAALLREEITHRERIGELAAAEAAAGIKGRLHDDEENARNAQSVAAISKRFDLREREATAEAFIADLSRKGLTTDQQRLATLKEQLEVIRAQLKQPQSQEQRTQLNIQRVNKENEINESGFQESLKPQSQRVAERNAAQLLQGDKERFQKEQDRTGGLENPHFGIGGNLIGGTDPATGKKVDITGNDSFNQFFHPGLIPDTGPAKGAVVGEDRAAQTTPGGGTAEIVGKLQQIIDIWR